MADNILKNIRIKHRSDTEAKWASQNPVLLDGELAISSDKSMFKTGDGTSTWSQLPYNSAFNDSTGQNIRSTYLKKVTASGQTLTLTKGDNTTSTITTQDTRNTAGSTNSGSKLFLIGAASQSSNPQTYSRSSCYIGTDGSLYSNSTKVSVDGHTHSYLPLTGGTMSGGISVNTNNAFDIGNASKKIRTIYANNLVGNADTASALKTSRDIRIGNITRSFNGNEDLAYPLDDMGVFRYGSCFDAQGNASTINRKYYCVGEALFDLENDCSTTTFRIDRLSPASDPAYCEFNITLETEGGGHYYTSRISVIHEYFQDSSFLSYVDSISMYIKNLEIGTLARLYLLIEQPQGGIGISILNEASTKNPDKTYWTLKKNVTQFVDNPSGGDNYADFVEYQWMSNLSLPDNLSTFDINTEMITFGGKKITGIADSASASAISNSANIVTERDIYYGLPKINNSHSYTSNSTYYAPSSGGTAGYELIGAGTTSAPVWKPPSYATCSTTAATTAKTVSISNFKLVTGCEVTVKFTYGNSAANPTLNVYSTGAKAVYYKGSAISATLIKANGIYKFVYDGTRWNIVGDIDTSSDKLMNYLPLTGGTVNGQLVLSRTTDVSGASASEGALVIGSKTGVHLAFDGNEIMAKAGATTTADLYLNNDGGKVYVGVGGIRSAGELQSATPNALRSVWGNYGFIIRNDGSNTYFLLTNSGDTYGSFNSLRPVTINNSTGKVMINSQYPLRVSSWDGTTLNLTYG